ncbi:hypothetical protein EV646_11124 [Kribbella antiqua]|uniref:Fibronectin type-III domain-containing protein n=1 Tax=Kribbella antiqua TaxID=2512217 RepID=A0A4R2IHS0_9ACTN|nr:choice-of-anchor D domain-containing protein [Kribbella antiqua]TCO43832.1 hypothetical protein EV646_11124 [Kribbella antiqua]
MRRARTSVLFRYALAAALAAITVPFLAHAAFGDEAVAAPVAQVFPTRQGIGVVWDAVDASGYRVERKQDASEWQDISGALAPSATNWIDESIPAGTTADYRVVAQSSDSEGATSAPVTASRAAQAPEVGDVDVLMTDADRGDGATWLQDEIVGPVTVSAPTGGSRILSAGAIKLRIPAFFPGPGTYNLTQTQVELTQGDRNCTTSGRMSVTELAYTSDLQVETMAASFQGWTCAGIESGLGVEIRIKSTKAYQALSVTPHEVAVGQVRSGTTSAPAPITVKNVGTEPVELERFSISSGAYWAWKISSNDCPAVLPVAASCTVKMTFAPNFIGLSRAKLVIGDSTSRGWHTVFYSATGTSLPEALGVFVSPTFTGNTVRWAALASAGGTPVRGYFLHRYVDGVETTQWVTTNRTSGFVTVADSNPKAGIEYAVSVVNDVGEGPTGARGKAARATEQIAVIGGEPTKRELMAADPLGQVVPLPYELDSVTPKQAVASSPDGRTLAYATGGSDRSLWIRKVEPSGLGTPVKLWTSWMGITRLSWSPDGSRIAVEAPGVEGDLDLPCVYVISSSGGTPEQIACDVTSPSWMPDARTLMVIDGRVEGTHPDLVRIEAKPGGAPVKSFNVTARQGDPVAASPDGRHIALAGGVGLSLIDSVTTTHLSNVTFSSSIKSISWAPDGGQLLALASNGQLSRISVGSDGDMKDQLPVTVWPSSTQPVFDVAWQRLGLVIKPTAAVMGPQISIAYDSSALLPGTTFTCVLDSARWLSSCESPVTTTVTSSGTHTLQVSATEPGGRRVVATRTFTVDATGPVSRVVGPTYQASAAGTASIQVAATDSSGVASYDVRYRKASYLSGFGAYVQPWTGTTATSMSLSVAAGYEYCVSVRAKDKFGNVGAWSAERCFGRPLDDRAMTTATTGWTRASWSAFYAGTATQTAAYGKSLTRTVQGKRFYLVATKCPTCGMVSVYAGGKYLTAVNLASTTTQRQALIALPVQSALFSGTLTFTTRSTGKLVQIDGLVVRRT